MATKIKKLNPTPKDLKKMEKTANTIVKAFNKFKLPPRIALAVLLGVADTVMDVGRIENAGHNNGKMRIEITRKIDDAMPKTDETPSYIR